MLSLYRLLLDVLVMMVYIVQHSTAIWIWAWAALQRQRGRGENVCPLHASVICVTVVVVAVVRRCKDGGYRNDVSISDDPS